METNKQQDDLAEPQNPSKAYLGWTNKRTWCVALTFNEHRDLRREATSYARDFMNRPYIVEKLLRLLAHDHRDLVASMAPWVWTPGQLDSVEDVDWKQLREHYEMRVSEERGFEVSSAGE